MERRLEHRFADPSLFERALTHSSYANEHLPCLHNDGLAFVGDAALALVVAEYLLALDGDAPVGVLTPRRAELVSGVNLARWAEELELGAMLRLGRGEDATGGRARESILATALEAVLGAIYLEGGLPAVRRAVAALAAW
ncbi:MAG TPA: ribonuclease III domain-containing protein [Candidatus Limnocylindria bacterium]|nr:ribonuclease III domain-containing protein [Candidatus Limnocylindria bacterium]